jgi:hypothetical protein
MSLEKAIIAGKEKRKAYRGSKVWDYSCRNHGSCDYCVNSRLHASKKQYGKTQDQEVEFFAAVAGYGDPTNVEMDRSEELLVQFGFDPDDRYDMVRSGLFWNPVIEQELKDNGETIL